MTNSRWMSLALLACLPLTGCISDEPGATDELDTSSVSLHGADHDHAHRDVFPDDTGWFASQREAGPIAHDGPFFDEFGTNGRTCGTCHAARDGWTITPDHVRALFRQTHGTHPLFRTNDGSTSPLADTSTLEARRRAYRLLLDRAVIRVGLPMPSVADFELIAVDDPYGYASARELSLFRRPLPATNLRFIPAVMWDGRVVAPTVDAALLLQADGATLGHAAALAPLPAAARAEIVAFERGLTTAQVRDRGAGRLDQHGGRGGVDELALTDRVDARFDLFDAWLGDAPDAQACDHGARAEARRAAIARGQELFNTRTNAAGRTCRGCHSVANVGSNANGTFFDIGVAAGTRRSADQPLYTFRNRATGAIRTTTDPGRALVTGKWADLNRFKVPVLRGLAARAPYFHDGSAESIDDVILFYEESLQFAFTADEEADLRAFLGAL
ncbi:MAG: hypothetical protein K8W52_29935 [Deltaproteobacteria bacterium]|nr:hypothetical protein [Deltaproteobacteria bacterium]